MASGVLQVAGCADVGYSPATIERHAVDSAAAYARYVAEVRTEVGGPGGR